MAVSVIQVSLQTGEDICPSFCRGSAVVFLIRFCFCGSGEGVELTCPLEPPSVQ